MIVREHSWETIYLIIRVDQPADRFLCDLFERVAQLIEDSNVNLSSQLRGGLVHQLNDLLGHVKWRLTAVRRICREDDDLSNEKTDFVTGRQLSKGLVREL